MDHFQNCMDKIISESDDSDVTIQCTFSIEDFLSCKSETISKALLNEDHRCRTCLQP